MADANELQAQLASYMQQHGLKTTRQRQAIFEAFVEAGHHVSVDDLLEQVHGKLPGIGYATVYRALKLFAEAGVAHERRFGDGQARYEPSADDHHDHLICEDCGHIFEFEDDVIERRQAEVAETRGLKVVSHRHVIFGRCEHPEDCEHREQP